MPSIAVAARDAAHGEPRWILDTGASVHLCGKAISGERIDLEQPVMLETANGQITVRDVIRADIESIGKGVACAEIPRDLQALSIGQLCAQDGFSLAWRPCEGAT